MLEAVRSFVQPKATTAEDLCMHVEGIARFHKQNQLLGLQEYFLFPTSNTSIILPHPSPLKKNSLMLQLLVFI